MDTQQLLEAAKTIETLQGMLGNDTKQWLPAVAAIGGVLATLIPNLILEKRRESKEKRSLETALISEVSGLLDVIEHRGYVRGLEAIVDDLKKGPNRTERFSVKIPGHYSQIYKNHLPKIGMIDPKLSEQIIRFHQLIDSVVQDIREGGLIADHGGDVDDFEQVISVLCSAITVGREITGLE